MLATTVYEYSRTITKKLDPRRIKRHRTMKDKDNSIELRRYLAAENAHREFEQHKDRALTDNHRASFVR
jgi:hypothetical protein